MENLHISDPSSCFDINFISNLTTFQCNTVGASHNCSDNCWVTKTRELD